MSDPLVTLELEFGFKTGAVQTAYLDLSRGDGITQTEAGVIDIIASPEPGVTDTLRLNSQDLAYTRTIRRELQEPGNG